MKRIGARRILIAWPTSKNKAEPGIRLVIIIAVKDGTVTRL